MWRTAYFPPCISGETTEREDPEKVAITIRRRAILRNLENRTPSSAKTKEGSEDRLGNYKIKTGVKSKDPDFPINPGYRVRAYTLIL